MFSSAAATSRSCGIRRPDYSIFLHHFTYSPAVTSALDTLSMLNARSVDASPYLNINHFPVFFGGSLF